MLTYRDETSGILFPAIEKRHDVVCCFCEHRWTHQLCVLSVYIGDERHNIDKFALQDWIRHDMLNMEVNTTSVLSGLSYFILSTILKTMGVFRREVK